MPMAQRRVGRVSEEFGFGRAARAKCRCHSSVVERHLGKVEVQGSSPCGSFGDASTFGTAQRSCGEDGGWKIEDRRAVAALSSILYLRSSLPGLCLVPNVA